jgi:hypothetical protein
MRVPPRCVTDLVIAPGCPLYQKPSRERRWKIYGEDAFVHTERVWWSLDPKHAKNMRCGVSQLHLILTLQKPIDTESPSKYGDNCIDGGKTHQTPCTRVPRTNYS